MRIRLIILSKYGWFKLVDLKKIKIRGYLNLSIAENLYIQEKKILVTCPICKAKKDVAVPREIINSTKQLTTVSIPKGTTCRHHFQLFIDNNFAIRGYQKVDYELIDKKDEEKEMTLEEIYEEFWELIDDDNPDFKHLIVKDLRRNASYKKKEFIVKEILIQNIHES